MACTGCQYLIGKEGTCNMTYACAGAQRVIIDSNRPAKQEGRKKKQKKESTGDSVNG